MASLFAVSGAVVAAPARALPPPVPAPPCAPTSSAPQGAGDIRVHDGANTCADPHRTLVFVGESVISNGVNFAGTGDSAYGGTYEFYGGGSRVGGCVMVNWDSVNASAPVITGVTDCDFFTTNGVYHGPTTADPVVKNTVGTNSPAWSVLKWAPDGPTTANPSATSQANCFNSSGNGVSTFSTQQAKDRSIETWTSNFSWKNSLNNLRGTIVGGPAGSPSSTYVFDAKIRSDPMATAPEPTDKTAAGCLEKTINEKAGRPSNSRTGLNNIQIVGTATWRLGTVTIFP